jgi:hypothetical protein
MALTGIERLTRGYMLSIYIDGARTFAVTNVSYHEPIKQCAAGLLTREQIDSALATGKISSDEYTQTGVYIGTAEANAWKTK